jgi:hypothetical protein
MGTKKIILSSYVSLCFIAFIFQACKKEDEGYPKFFLSDNAKKWFVSMQEGYLTYRSNTGLTEGYKVEIKKYMQLGTFNGKQGLGEVYKFSMTANLGDQDFSFVLSNVDNPEHLEIGAYWYLIENPSKAFRTTSYTQGTSLGLYDIGDTLINNQKYQDVYIQYSINESIKEMYLSQSKGLLGYKTSNNLTWYKN